MRSRVSPRRSGVRAGLGASRRPARMRTECARAADNNLRTLTEPARPECAQSNRAQFVGASAPTRSRRLKFNVVDKWSTLKNVPKRPE